MSFTKLLFLAIFIFSLNLNSSEVSFEFQAEAKLSSNPIYQFYDGSALNIITEGIDQNNNGELDDGDTPPAWYRFTFVNNFFDGVKVTDLLFSTFEKGKNISFDKETNKAFVVSYGRVIEINLNESDYTILDEIENAEDAVFLDPYLFVLTDNGTDQKLVHFDPFGKIINTEVDLEGNAEKIAAGVAGENLEKFVAISFDNSRVELIKFDEEYHASQNSFNLEIEIDDIFYLNETFLVTQKNSDQGIAYTFLDSESGFIRFNLGVNSNIESLIEFNSGFVISTEEGEFAFSDGNLKYKDYYDPNERLQHLVNWDNEFLVAYDESISKVLLYAYEFFEPIFAYSLIDVGTQPVKSYYDSKKNLLHVFCLGQDLNFNGIQDAEDEVPSWWIVRGQSGSYFSEKVREFEFGSLQFPFRPAIDKENDLLYIPHPDRVALYDLLDYSILDNNLWSGNPSAISLAGPHKLITVPGGFDETGEIVVFDATTQNELQVIETEENPQKSIYFNYEGAIWFAILNNGVFGEGKSTIQYAVLPHMQQPTLKSVNVGATANDLVFKNGNIYSVANGSHEIYKIDLSNDNVSKLNLGSNNFDGPREIEFVEFVEDGETMEAAVITSYSGLLPIYEENKFVSILPFSSNYRVEDFEPIDLNNLDFPSYAICAPYDYEYSNNDQVAIAGQFNSSVKEFKSEEVSSIKIFPAPVNGNFTIKIEGLINNFDYEIFDISGNMIFKGSSNSSRIDLNSNKIGLNSGTYFARILGTKSQFSIKFNVTN